MKKICLVSCASSKRDIPSKAVELYISPLFKKASEYARQNFQEWYILSAKHGLLSPDKVVAPYDLTLNNMPVKQRMEWAESVYRSLRDFISPGDEVTILAGNNYREFLEPRLPALGVKVVCPLRGMSIGRQLQWLDAHIESGTRATHLNQFYTILGDLSHAINGPRILAKSRASDSWPKRGVYFFFEPGEVRSNDRSTSRVVRVGTHGVSRNSQSTLWGRLRTHRGSSDGQGNHRGSIFRLHVGSALIAQSNGVLKSSSWGVGQIASAEIRSNEELLEKMVSDYIGRMSVLWLRIEDDSGPSSDRAYIERNAIGLLAGPLGPYDLASDSWLGNKSPHPTIRASALWNVDHVAHHYDPLFLEILQEFADVTLGRKQLPEHSIAPSNWNDGALRRGTRQMTLFGGTSGDNRGTS